jgi:hypothetical protein
MYIVEQVLTPLTESVKLMLKGAEERGRERTSLIVAFLGRLIAMWKDMRDCHQAQRRALEAMNSIHKGAPAEPTTAFHHQSTLNLEISLFKYYTCPQKICLLFSVFPFSGFCSY